MKVAFIYGSADYYKDNDGAFYSGGTINKQVWERYLKHFEHVIALGRYPTKDVDLTKLTKVSHENVSIEMTLPLNGPKQLVYNSSEVRRKCRELLTKVDIAIIRLPSLMGVIACEEAQKLKKPYMVEVVGCIRDALWHHGAFTGKIAALLFYRWNKNAIKNAPFAIYVTQEFLQERYPTKGLSVGCSDVTLKMPSEEVLQKRINKIENYNEETVFKIGMIGSLNIKYKGHKEAFEAIKILNNKFQIELHILGEGDRSRWDKQLRMLDIDNKIFFDGVLPSGLAVYDWMDQLDLYITPSYTEGLPRAVVEAMSRALPIVASDIGGIPELISKEHLFEVKNSTQLAEKISIILSNRDNILKIANENFWSSKKYEESNLEKIRNNFFQECVNSIKS